MPNHVTNIISFTGDPEEIEKLFLGVRSEESLFDFNQIVLMPKEIEDTESGRESWEARKIIGYAEEHNITIEESVLIHADRNLNNIGKYIENYKKYGFTDWYEWSAKKWGTKCNAYSVDLDSESNTINFYTAWSTPYPVIKELSRLYPTITIEVRYADEDLGQNCGIYTLLNGECIDSSSFNYGDEDSLRFACEVKGYEYDEVRAEMNQDTK